ncbi:hypothetical protein NGB36_06585 [Streptomyces sp. RB6PN25]|uniref:PBS lyase n=1 Tax=Streptomyces humicola TaxID=2953240 RepID=A0ABT1PRH6_9ACTN|nr:HEAT repeat domain-containing protein [Streptomyces humicola]MCQ4080271.1 hypothetical protein [Streptomyces humicola]
MGGKRRTGERAEAALLRRGQARSVLRRRSTSPETEAQDTGRWERLCREASTGRRAAADVLLDEVWAVDAGGTAQERRRVLEQLLAAPPHLWLHLDRFARRGSYGSGSSGLSRRRGLPADADPLHLVLASFDADGRVRQAAVERLARRSGRFVAMALTLRTDDWVEQVREPAVAALLDHVAPDEAAVAIRLLSRLDRRRRAGGVLDAYRAALCRPERRRTVRRLAAEPDPHVRRFGVELALDLGEYVRGDLARTALHDRDQVCRALCAERLLELDPDQAGRLMGARSAAVRELAVAALPDDVPATRLVAPLADRSRMVRAQARWKLYKRGEPPVDVYRKQLRRCGRSTQPRLVAGLTAGLGECGEACDVPMLEVLARDESWAPVVRRAAVRALGRLGSPEQLAAALGPISADPAPSLAREALDALAAAGAAAPQPVRSALARPEPPVWRAALRAARATAPWDRLELSLNAAADPRPELAARGRTDVRTWLRTQVYELPDADQLQRIRGLLDRAGLPAADRDGLAFILSRLRPGQARAQPVRSPGTAPGR